MGSKVNQPRLLPAALAAFLLAASSAWAADKTWNGNTSTDWALAANWTGGLPTNADRVVIPAAPARLPIIGSNTALTINQLLITAPATLTINSTFTLTIVGGASPVIDGTGTVITAGTGQINVTGGPVNGTLINSSMTLGNFTLSAPAGRNLGIPSPNVVTVNGGFSIASSEIQLGTAAGAATTLDINGPLTVTGSLIMRSNNNVVRVSGNWTQSGIFTCGTGSTVVMDGTAAQTITQTNNTGVNVQFANLRISTTGGACTYAANGNLATGFVVLDNFTLDAGTTTVVQEPCIIGTAVTDTLGIGSGATITFQQRFDPDCTIAFDIDAGAQDGVLVMQGTQLPPSDTSDFGFALRAGHGTVRVEVTQSQTFALTNGGPYSFWNLVINTDTGNNQVDGDIITTTAAFTVLNNLSLLRCQFQIAAVTIDVFGSIISGPSTQSQLDFTGAGTLAVRGNVDLGSVSQVTSGTTGPFATIYMNGTTPQTFQIHATTASQYFDLDALRIGNPSGVTVLDNPNADFTVNGQLAIDAGAKLTVQDAFDPKNPVVFAAGGGNILRLENIITAGPDPFGSSFVPATGTVVYAGQSIAQIVYTQNNGVQIPYYNLTIDNTGGVVATQQNAGVLRVDGTFTIQGAPSSFTGFSNGMTVGGSFISNGTFTHGGGPVTMTGTGSIGGTSASLTFSNLNISGSTAAQVVSAARSFTTAGTFQVTQGTMTTLGIAAPITMTANLGMSVTGSGIFNLVGPATLAVASAQTFSVASATGRFTALANAAGTPTLTRSGAAGTFTATLSGQVNLYGLNFSFADAAGMNITGTATLERLRNVRFTNVNAVAGSRHLTIAINNLNLDCPGCWFDTVPAGVFNVQARGANTGMRLRFEDRGTLDKPAGQGIGGPGAGDARNNDDDLNSNGVLTDAGETATGSIVQWVYTANIDMVGAMQGAPVAAFDWNTFTYYSTYVVMNSGAGTTDTIYVLDANGDVRPGYSFSPGAAAGNISGFPFWDTEAGTHVLYFGTTTGIVYKLIDNGSTLAPPASGPWTTPFSDGTLQYVSTTIMSDQTNLYFGGNDNFNPGNSTSHWGMYRVAIATKTMPIGAINLQRAAVNSDNSWSDTAGGRMVFQATGQATNGTSSIYRLRTTSWTIDATLNSTSAFTAPGNVPLDTLFVGEANGRMHAVAALGTSAQFLERTGFPFTVNTNAVAGGAVWDNQNIVRQPTLTGGRLFFGSSTGELFALYLYPAAWTLNTNYYRVATAGAASMQSQPLVQAGVLYSSNNGGKMYVFDADNGAGPQLMTTYTLFGNAATGDLSRDSIGSGRIYIGTAAGRVYSIVAPTDPTPSFP